MAKEGTWPPRPRVRRRRHSLRYQDNAKKRSSGHCLTGLPPHEVRPYKQYIREQRTLRRQPLPQPRRPRHRQAKRKAMQHRRRERPPYRQQLPLLPRYQQRLPQKQRLTTSNTFRLLRQAAQHTMQQGKANKRKESLRPRTPPHHPKDTCLTGLRTKRTNLPSNLLYRDFPYEALQPTVPLLHQLQLIRPNSRRNASLTRCPSRPRQLSKEESSRPRPTDVPTQALPRRNTTLQASRCHDPSYLIHVANHSGRVTRVSEAGVLYSHGACALQRSPLCPTLCDVKIDARGVPVFSPGASKYGKTGRPRILKWGVQIF